MGQLLDFGGADLEVNRNGRLSSSQRQRLLATSLILPCLAIAIGGLVSGALWLTWVAYANAGKFAASASWENAPVWVRLVVLLPAAYALFNVRSGLLKAMRDVLGGGVRHTDGILTAETVERKSKDRRHKQTDTVVDYYYVASGKRFRVNRPAYDALLPGIACRVYYSVGTHQVLSLEAAPTDADENDSPSP